MMSRFCANSYPMRLTGILLRRLRKTYTLFLQLGFFPAWTRLKLWASRGTLFHYATIPVVDAKRAWAAAIGATTFVQLGAMSVKIGFRTMALQAMSVAFLAAVLSAIAVTLNRAELGSDPDSAISALRWLPTAYCFQRLV